MKQLCKKFILIIVILFPILIISIIISKYPLIYLSPVLVDKIEVNRGGYHEVNDYKEYELCKALSSIKVSEKTKYEFKIATADGGFTYRIRIKFHFNISMDIFVNTADMEHFDINSKYVYKCREKDISKLIDILSYA